MSTKSIITSKITIVATLVALSACSLATKPIPLAVTTVQMRVETIGTKCENGWTKAHRYLLGEGIDITYSDISPLVLICADIGFHVHGFGIARSDGVAVVVASSISSEKTAKLIVHELQHIFGHNHSALGTMAALSELQWLGG